MPRVWPRVWPTLTRASLALVLAMQCGISFGLTDRAATEQVQAQLLASVDAVYPGEAIVVGVRQKIIPHWHTYWLNPGDSGIATTIAWDLPAGAVAGEILWPTPGRSSLGPVTNYSYETEVVLPSKIRVPTDIHPGGIFAVVATVDWLVCREECIPQRVKLGLNLPVLAPGQTRGNGSPLIAQALASLPVASPWPIIAESGKKGITLKILSPELKSKALKEIWFYPERWGVIAQSADQPRHVDGDAVVLKLAAGDAALKPGEALGGVLAVTEDSAEGLVSRGFNVNVKTVPPVSGTESDSGFLPALLLALLGGAILNVMPCVFPVLSIKALSLVSHAHQSPLQMRLHGLTYAIGVLFSFAALGGALIVLKAGGAQIGWGFQFQSPLFVLAIAYLMFAVGLSLSGVYAVGNSITGAGSAFAGKPGYTGSFFTGALATIVATPCTAPFMAAALGYALAQPPLRLMAVFLSLGLGLASPYLLLTAWPPLQRHLPRPGAWMERARQALAFPMYAAAVWLVWVLAQELGANAVAVALGGMVAIAFAAWLYDVTRHGGQLTQHGGVGVAAIALLVALAGSYIGVESSAIDAALTASSAVERDWEPYTPERLHALRAEGKPVFMNFTAAWCISCQVNERIALSDATVVHAFRQSGITYLKGDWTNRDPEVTEILAQFGRAGVPLYVWYPPGAESEPVELPQILTPEVVLHAIRNPSFSVAVHS